MILLTMAESIVGRGMSSQPVAYFKCDDCGVKARSDIIEYDGLGYPVCPACGRTYRPSVRGSGARRSDGRRSEV